MKGVRRMGASFLGVIIGALALLVLLPTTAQGSRDLIAPTADGYLSFDVGVSIYDQAIWQYKFQGECDIYSSTGKHTISADAEPAASSAWTAFLPVKKTKKGYVPVRPISRHLLLNNDTSSPERTASARYNLNSTRSVEPTSNTGDCAPIGCPDCGSSEPPQEKCGTQTGSVEFRILGSPMPANAKRASFMFEDFDWTPYSPFQTERTYCTEGGFWHWQDGWPGFTTPDGGPYLRVDTSKLLGYFRKLGPKQRLKCNVFVDLPKYCSKANYIRMSKTVQREDINLPGNRDYKEQTSILFLKFRFGVFGQFRKDGSTCFPRPGKPAFPRPGKKC